MQTSKTRASVAVALSGFGPERTGSTDGQQKSSPATPKSTRLAKTSGSESDLTSTRTPTRSSAERSPKVIDRRSPRSPVPEKKRPSRVTDLEAQVVQLQEDLKKTKEQLVYSETWRRKAQQEAEEAKKQLQTMTSQLEESQNQLVEFSAAEEARLQELRKISQDRDRAWQSELEAIQKQHCMDSAALNSAIGEMQRLKMQLDMAVRSESAQLKQSELAHSELQTLKQNMVETMSVVGNLRAQLQDTKNAESEAQAMINDRQQQLEVMKNEAEVHRAQESKLITELEESQARVSSLEEMVKKLQEDMLIGESKGTDSGMETEMEQLKAALEAAELKHQQELIQSTMQLNSARGSMEKMKAESEQKEAALIAALKNAEAEVLELKANIDREQNLQSMPKDFKVEEKELELAEKLRKSREEVSELKANLMDKENEFQSILEENEQLKSEVAIKEADRRKSYEDAMTEVELAKAAERDAALRLGHVTEEAEKSSRRAARVGEQLDAAQAVNAEMETELRRLRVQSDQWRKAAEAAAAVLTTGNDGRFMDRTASMDTDYNSIAGKLISSPFSDDLSDDSPKKKNGNVLKKIGGLWKKAPK